MQVPAVMGLTLVEAQSPSVAVDLAPRLRRADRYNDRPVGPTEHDRSEELVREPEPMDEVLLTDMLDRLLPNWARRRTFYLTRERLTGLRDEPSAYAVIDSQLGTRFDFAV